MIKLDDYNKTDLQKYQKLIDKLMYLAYGTKPNIVFAIKQLNRHNANLKKNYL